MKKNWNVSHKFARIVVINRNTAKKIYQVGLEKPLPCVKIMAHGKDWVFAVCSDLGHTAKNASLPYVKSRGTRQRFSHRQSP